MTNLVSINTSADFPFIPRNDRVDLRYKMKQRRIDEADYPYNSPVIVPNSLGKKELWSYSSKHGYFRVSYAVRECPLR